PIGYGAWRERHSVRASTLLRAPENAAAEQLALVPINMATAYLMLHAYDTVSAGDWVLQNAANSNVGHYFEIFAKRAGINVINVVRRSALIDTLKNQGRSHVLVDSDSLAGDVAAITSDPPKIALDAIGGPATTRLGACVAMHGLVLSYGFLSKQPHALAYPDLVFRNVRLRGVLTNYAMERLDADGLARMRSEMDAVMNSGQLSAEIAGIYTFSEAAEALRHAAKTGADRHGKVILKPD
ncbi:MAG: zinc-binding dehydrogenase, partial [Pseudomonadota bacterium]